MISRKINRIHLFIENRTLAKVEVRGVQEGDKIWNVTTLLRYGNMVLRRQEKEVNEDKKDDSEEIRMLYKCAAQVTIILVTGNKYIKKK